MLQFSPAGILAGKQLDSGGSVGVVIDKGSRVVILGLNGAGKTTLLRILAGELESDTGDIF